MTDTMTKSEIKPTRIGRLGERLIAGIDGHYDMTTRYAIPSQWASFAAMEHPADAMVPNEHFGVCHHVQPDGQFGYLCGMQVRKGEAVPQGLASQTVPAGNYAKFRCPVHIAKMHDEWNRVMGEWLPGSGYLLGDGPCVEYYGPDFDATTGEGGFELWIPVKKQA